MPIIIAILVALSACGWAAQLELSADPPLPCANIVENPSFEQGAGVPTAWRFTTANPENFVTGLSAEGHTGRCIHIKSHTGVMSGYWGQSVPVLPRTPYVLTGWFRIAGGKLLTYVHARAADGATLDERFYANSMRNHFLVPVFLKPEYMRGLTAAEWYPLRIEFTPPEGMEWVAVSAGLYFEAGEVWYDDLAVFPLKTDLSVKVTGDRADIARVRVLSSEGDKPLLDKTLDPPVDGFETELGAVPTEAQYTLEAADAQGNTTRCVYP